MKYINRLEDEITLYFKWQFHRSNNLTGLVWWTSKTIIFRFHPMQLNTIRRPLQVFFLTAIDIKSVFITYKGMFHRPTYAVPQFIAFMLGFG